MKKLTSPSTLKQILQEHGIKLSPHSRGQNFLVDYNVLQKILETAHLTKNDLILEIGSGLGTLTRELAHKTKAVFAVELDKKIYQILTEKTLSNYKNITVVNKDALSKSCYLDFTKWLKSFASSNADFPKYKLVANIPYTITSKVIRQFLETTPQANEIIIMVQKEVAQRIMAKPGKMNLLALSVQYYGKPEIIMTVSKNSFLPRPKVDSAILAIRNIKRLNPAQKKEAKKIFQLAHIGFASKRKQLQNNLSSALNIKKDKIKQALIFLNLPPNARAQELSVAHWQKLANMEL